MQQHQVHLRWYNFSTIAFFNLTKAQGKTFMNAAAFSTIKKLSSPQMFPRGNSVNNSVICSTPLRSFGRKSYDEKCLFLSTEFPRNKLKCVQLIVDMTSITWTKQSEGISGGNFLRRSTIRIICNEQWTDTLKPLELEAITWTNLLLTFILLDFLKASRYPIKSTASN